MQAGPQRTERTAAGGFGQEFGNVLQFPQRDPAPLISGAGTGGLVPDAADEFARYEQDEPLDDRTRTLMNMIAVAIVTLLITAGVWVADIISAMDRDQDCIMQGRSNCAPIKVPPAGQ